MTPKLLGFLEVDTMVPLMVISMTSSSEPCHGAPRNSDIALPSASLSLFTTIHWRMSSGTNLNLCRVQQNQQRHTADRAGCRPHRDAQPDHYFSQCVQ